jgi:deoxyribodipyrimidine photolyase-related protein
MQVFLIFPHQLFEQILSFEEEFSFYVVESELFFKQFNFHKQKILFHRASMQAFASRLRAAGKNVEYVESHDIRANEVQLVSSLGTVDITLFDPNDYLLERRIRRASTSSITLLSSPNFLNGEVDLVGNRKPYFQTSFYVQQRKDRQILLEIDGKPKGGQWTFDSQNRKKIPKNTFIPVPFPESQPNAFILEAIDYVETYFPNNLGSSEMPFSGAYYPVTHAEALAALDQFVRERLMAFGDYEDAIKAQEKTLFHSILSPLINVGLLNPAQVIARIEASQAHINSVEGFIRQVLGWREFVQLLYRKIGVQQRKTNYWGFTREMPASFYTGNTGVLPIDQTIRKLLKTGYNHHIERLMILGNFMLLCEIKPDAVYRWFMEMYIDSYDWVMVPNLYGMSQFSDGGLMTTKPYICGSNYILKMSDYPKGAWQEIWDGLFWRFLDKQRETFRKNPRWAMLIKTWDKMPEEKKSIHVKNAQTFLDQLFA